MRALMTAVVALSLAGPALAGAPKKVLCSTFPIYQITRSVAQGYAGVSVELMLPAGLGCPHDYVLTPQDMKKISTADALVINGLGMEEFLGAPLRDANAKLVVIDTSKGIEGALGGDDDHHHHHDHGQKKEAPKAEADHKEHGHHHDHDHGPNPHLFSSPRMAARLAMNAAAGLSKLDPEGAAAFFRNATAEAERLNKLADEFEALGKRLKNKRIVTQHSVFDYLARDMGLEVVATVRGGHAGEEPSAAEVIEVIKTIREKKAGAVFLEPQYPGRIGQTIAREAGVPAALLDPVASGPADAPLDYYETVMRRNLETLAKTLGVK